MALWGLSAIGLFVGYRPPKRHTGYDHLTLWQKIGRLDLPGFFLLTAGLAIFLAGLNIGGGMFPWTAAPVLATLIVGILCLIFFGVYEWRFTKTGILSHELFRGGETGGRTFALCVGLIFIEGILLFSYTIFFPTLFVPPCSQIGDHWPFINTPTELRTSSRLIPSSWLPAESLSGSLVESVQ